ncbi:MAG: CDP-alcohol phosphatidyltransferase family protein [Bellilinea sp.]
MEQSTDKKTPASFTDLLRIRFKGLLDPAGAHLNKLGISPNTMTLLGLAGHIGAAVLLAYGEIQWGGLVVLLMAPFDALDGTMARLRGKTSRFGGFLDSVVDRYAELILVGGLLVYYIQQANWLAIALAYVAAAGSIMVSYTKARGESLGFKVNVGLLTRVERYLVIIPCLLFNIPLVLLWVLALFTNFTALQRIFTVFKQSEADDDLLK